MTSSVDITNRALQAIGTRSTIASMSEDSNESNNASLCYAATRRELIRAAPWNFATATATLALIKRAGGGGPWQAAGSPPPGWDYEYVYPADCLRARRIVGCAAGATGPGGSGVSLFPGGLGTGQPGLGGAGWGGGAGVRFQVTTDLDPAGNPFTCILANVDQAILCYLRDVSVEDMWDPLFSEAMVYALGGRLALALTTDKAIAQLAFSRADAMILTARAADANEGMTVMDAPVDWITRGHGIVWLPGGAGGGGAGGYALPFGPLFG